VFGIWSLAAAMFAIAIATDAFDGRSARRWPYPVGEHRWWRRNPSMFDMIADGSLTLLALFGLSVKMPIWWLVFAVALLSAFGFLAVIKATHKFNTTLAEKIQVVHGLLNGALMFAMLVAMTIKATSHWPLALGFYLMAGGLLLIFIGDRVVSRPEVRRK
jgi:phosphatidylglycerophosphate synthase